MGSENDKTRQGLWNRTERFFDNRHPEFKSLKRQKTPAKSFVWADELKRQFTYTLKPSKCSNTDITKGKSHEEPGARAHQEGMDADKLKPSAASKAKFFSDMNIENIFVNSEYFKMKSGNMGSISFCSGENGENRWTIDAKTSFARKSAHSTSDRTKDASSAVEEDSKMKRPADSAKKTEAPTQAEELRHLKNNVDAMIQEMKLLNRDFGLVRMDLKTIEKLIRLQKQSQTKKEGTQGDVENANSKLGKFSENVEKAAQELKDFIENNRNLLADTEDVLSPCAPDFDRIINNLHRLSETAYQPKIIQTSKGAKFEVPRELPISLYSDGMLLRNDDFRKYTDMKASLFLRDIEDGFFPSELWPEFPYGVPFQVTDRRCETFNGGDAKSIDRFPGNGRRLGSSFDGKPSTMVYLEPTKLDGIIPDEAGSGEPDRRANCLSAQEHRRSLRGRSATRQRQVHPTVEEVGPPADNPKAMSVKVRLGHGKEGLTLCVDVMSNEKMNRFQDALFRKLCERYHDEYVKSAAAADRYDDDSVPDFEVHIYGRKPFRLSEHLGLYPSECGIVDNCVVNVTEI